MHDSRKQMGMQMGVGDGWTDGSEMETKSPGRGPRCNYTTKVIRPREYNILTD